MTSGTIELEEDDETAEPAESTLRAMLGATATLIALVLLWELSCRQFQIPSWLLSVPSLIAQSMIEWHSELVQSRSVGESGMLILHSGRHYGPSTSRQRHDHARHPNCDTAIESFAQRLSRAVWIEPEDGSQVA